MLLACAKSQLCLPKKAPNPFPLNYRPEIDTSPELPEDQANYFQTLIGIAIWLVELGRIDIHAEVSMLSSHIALPRRGHMSAILHLFSYLKKKHNATLAFDPTYPDIDPSQFAVSDWRNFYGDINESTPIDAPAPKGKELIMRCFVDADHAGDLLTRRSRTGFLIYLNNAPIYWYSKKQTTIETSTFGSEFVAMKIATEYIRGLRYKLRTMGIRIDQPTFVYGDNQSVLKNVTLPESTLKKKSNSIAYHFVRESVALGETIHAYIPSGENFADLLTKSLTGIKRSTHVQKIMYDLT